MFFILCFFLIVGGILGVLKYFWGKENLPKSLKLNYIEPAILIQELPLIYLIHVYWVPILVANIHWLLTKQLSYREVK